MIKTAHLESVDACLHEFETPSLATYTYLPMLFVFRAANIPSCLLGSAQENKAEAMSKLMR